jgi:hypothetical protein
VGFGCPVFAVLQGRIPAKNRAEPRGAARVPHNSTSSLQPWNQPPVSVPRGAIWTTFTLTQHTTTSLRLHPPFLCYPSVAPPSTPAYRAQSVTTRASVDLGVDHGSDFDLQGAETPPRRPPSQQISAHPAGKNPTRNAAGSCDCETTFTTPIAHYERSLTTEQDTTTTRWSRLKGDRHLRKDAGRQVCPCPGHSLEDYV